MYNYKSNLLIVGKAYKEDMVNSDFSGYNSAFHKNSHFLAQDQLFPSIDGDFTSWYNDSVKSLMYRAPLGIVQFSSNAMEEYLRLGKLASFRDVSNDLKRSAPLQEVRNQLDALMVQHRGAGPLFCRLDQCSLKDVHPVRCYSNAQDVLLDALQDRRAYDWIASLPAMKQHTSIICSQWSANLRKHNEWRVFVCRGVVTGISQYAWYVCEKSITKQNAVEVGQNILPFIDRLKQALGRGTEELSMTVDVFVDNAFSNPRLIEINPFGATSGCGSALFHWEKDETILYGQSGCVQVRYLIK